MSELDDALRLLDGIERLHPDPFRSVSRESLERQAKRASVVPPSDRCRAIAELMRLAAMLGERNGHTGILPLRAHPIPLSVYPLRLHEFEDGVFVVAADAPELAGRELIAIAGAPVAEVMDCVTPLVPADNEWTVRARRPGFVVVAELLRGLGIIEAAERVAFRLGGRGGEREVELEPRPVRPESRPASPHRAAVVGDGRVLHVAYDVTSDASALAAQAGVAARSGGVGGIVLDLRRNAGGDNSSYGQLLELLETLAVSEGKTLAVLISRITFSAAMQLVVDLEERTPAVFVGEPTGGSPNHYGDAVSVELDRCGMTARVATIAWTTAGEADERAAKEPDVHVAVESSSFLAREDPVLAAALERL